MLLAVHETILKNSLITIQSKKLDILYANYFIDNIVAYLYHVAHLDIILIMDNNE